jgi:hypothetical protein
VSERTRRERFDRDGFVAVHDLLAADEVAWYRDVYERNPLTR